ncbi:uncharacterized protein Dwil_GK11617 [Drosophila willistoni]|uniref:Uncharacterized protein n=1 Tax=Drosophila willistoni TaxID=7260 RepID=B4N9N7_DROWI|nr:uncharacterized protein Dwil_GK11617 [Drosophila willistoni]
MAPPIVGQSHGSSLIINALMWLPILLFITMSSWSQPVASQQFPPYPLTLPPLPLVLPVEHGKSNYHEPATEALSGLAGYERNYYDGAGDDYTRTSYGNYAQNIQTHGTTANGFVPYPSSRFSLPTESQEPATYYHNFAYQPREQPISNYREDRERQLLPLQARQATSDDEVQTRHKQHQRTAEPVKRQQEELPPRGATTAAKQQQQQHQDQQSLYSHSEVHIANAHSPPQLPPITTSIHHTPSSSKALAGLPLAKHIEITKHVPITHYQKQHVPYKQAIQIQVPRTVINTIPKPMAIKIPISKTVAVPQLQEVKIPIEKIKPVPVERPMPFVVERRVPYRVEKPVATPFYYPYPVKVPIVRTIVHKQRPAHYTSGIIGGGIGWSTNSNQLLG